MLYIHVLQRDAQKEGPLSTEVKKVAPKCGPVFEIVSPSASAFGDRFIIKDPTAPYTSLHYLVKIFGTLSINTGH